METAGHFAGCVQTVDHGTIFFDNLCLVVDQDAAHEVVSANAEAVSVQSPLDGVEVFLTSESVIGAVCDIFIEGIDRCLQGFAVQAQRFRELFRSFTADNITGVIQGAKSVVEVFFTEDAVYFAFILREDGIRDLKAFGCEALCGIGQNELADRLVAKDRSIRGYLLKVYRQLPHCVTQGDENFSNVLIDGQQCLAGLIDFNLAGTDVCANLIANNADFDLDIMHDRPVDAEAVLEKALIGYRRNATVILREYRATVAELEALPYYAWIALAAQYPYTCAYIDRIGQDGCRESTLRLLELIAELDLNRLRVEEE